MKLISSYAIDDVLIKVHYSVFCPRSFIVQPGLLTEMYRSFTTLTSSVDVAWQSMVPAAPQPRNTGTCPIVIGTIILLISFDCFFCWPGVRCWLSGNVCVTGRYRLWPMHSRILSPSRHLLARLLGCRLRRCRFANLHSRLRQHSCLIVIYSIQA